MAKVMKMLNRRRVELFTITLTANKLYAQYSCNVCSPSAHAQTVSQDHDQCMQDDTFYCAVCGPTIYTHYTLALWR